jgi:hypothetical protein
MKPPTRNARANAPNMDSLSVRGLFVSCRNCGHKTAIDVNVWPYITFRWRRSARVPLAKPAWPLGKSKLATTVMQPARQPRRYSDTELNRAAGQAAGDLTPVTERRLSAEQRRALAMLATAGTKGLTQQFLVVCSSDAAIVAAFVDEGLATMTRVGVQVGDKMIEVATVRIADSGRDALVSEH